jgi:hypothetical protein
MSYETVGENRVSLPHIDRTFGLGAVRPPRHDGPYIRQDTVRLLCGFFGKTLISLHCLPILRLLGLLGTS